MAFWSWSKTAALDAIADNTINWSEGMSPGSVNDSARAMMARLAEYRDDISGLLVTGGSSTAYTLTTNQVFAATPQNGQLIVFTPHDTNGIASTLQCDSGNTYPLQTSPGVAVPAATLVAGTPYSAKFNSTVSAWILRNVYGNPFNVPLGVILPYTGSSAPNSNFVLPYGQAISRTIYASYFALVGTAFGSGDGVTTFNVPDLRGRVIACIDNMGGPSASRLTSAYFGVSGDTIGNSGGAQSHTLTIPEIPSHSHTPTVQPHSHTFAYTNNDTNTGGANKPAAGNGTGFAATGTTSSSTVDVTIANTGGGTAHAIVQPTMVMTSILRII